MVQRYETVTAGEDEELASSLVQQNLPLIKDEEYIYKLIESLSLISGLKRQVNVIGNYCYWVGTDGRFIWRVICNACPLIRPRLQFIILFLMASRAEKKTKKCDMSNKA